MLTKSARPNLTAVNLDDGAFLLGHIWPSGLNGDPTAH
jgi:hypothetical protein